MRARSTRLMLAALVASATGVASAAGAGPALAVADVARRVECGGAVAGLAPVASRPVPRLELRGAAVDDGSRAPLVVTWAAHPSPPLVAWRPTTPAPAAPPRRVLDAPPRVGPAPRALAVLPHAPKTSPPTT